MLKLNGRTRLLTGQGKAEIPVATDSVRVRGTRVVKVRQRQGPGDGWRDIERQGQRTRCRGLCITCQIDLPRFQLDRPSVGDIEVPDFGIGQRQQNGCARAAELSTDRGRAVAERDKDLGADLPID